MKKIHAYTALIAQMVLTIIVTYMGSTGIVLAQTSDSTSSCPSGQIPVTDGNGNPKFDSNGNPLCKSIDALGPLGP